MNRSRSASILSVIAMLLIIAVAAGLDQLLYTLRLEASRLAQPVPVLWCYTLSNLLLGGLLLALIILVLIRLPRNPWVAVVYLLVGVYISAYPVLYFSPVGPYLVNWFISPRSFVYSSGGIIAFLGLAILIDPLKRWMNSGR
jgi:hypothetical protein